MTALRSAQHLLERIPSIQPEPVALPRHQSLSIPSLNRDMIRSSSFILRAMGIRPLCSRSETTITRLSERESHTHNRQLLPPSLDRMDLALPRKNLGAPKTM